MNDDMDDTPVMCTVCQDEIVCDGCGLVECPQGLHEIEEDEEEPDA